MHSRMPVDASLIWKFLWILAWFLRPLSCQIEVEGFEHVPTDGPYVLASNHSMGPDFVAVDLVLPRQVFYMVKSEVFAVNPWLTKFMFAIGLFPVERGQHDSGALEAAVDILRQGKVLGMYPEGTRSRDGNLQRGKSGAVRIAMVADVPFVPVAVLNSDQMISGFKRLRHKPLVSVRFGEPIRFEGSVGDPATVRGHVQESMVAIARLLPEERRGHYAEAAKEADTSKEGSILVDGQ